MPYLNANGLFYEVCRLLRLIIINIKCSIINPVV